MSKRKMMENKKILTKFGRDKKILTLTMDLQAVNLASFLPTEKLYFNTKLYCHNFTIFNLGTRDVTFYWYCEDRNNQLTASRFRYILHNIDYILEKTVLHLSNYCLLSFIWTYVVFKIEITFCPMQSCMFM